MLSLPQAILFDLDGTLADTAPDLAYALNQTLRHYGQPPLPFAQIRPVVSHGGVALIKLGFGLPVDSPEFAQRRQYLLDIYQHNLCRKTRLFDGMQSVLEYLEKAQIHWGIVTNKPAWLTDPLMQKMRLDVRTRAIVSGDTCANRKPHPEPIEHACALLGIEPQHTWYIGDAGRDMQAGKAAGCAMNIGAAYGYIYPDDPIETWGADAVIEKPGELIAMLHPLVPYPG